MALCTTDAPEISESVATGPVATIPSHIVVSPSPTRPTKARPLRFILVGGLATLTQLGLLAVLLRPGWSAILANAAALLVSTQVNFALNAVFTWGDRWDGAANGSSAGESGARLIAARWLRFMGAAAGTLLLNEVCYALLRHILPSLIAAGLCSAAIALLNYLLGDRLIFAPRRSTDLHSASVPAN